MLYIEDLKRAYSLKRSVEKIEETISGLKKHDKNLICTMECEMLEYKLSILNGSLSEVVDFIKNCEDSLVSQAMYYRYLCGKTWGQTAQYLGAYNTADCIRAMVGRYLDKKGVIRRKNVEKER